MENATKALLIAGGVLIAILIISAGIYLYIQFSNQSREYNSIISATELQKFNSNFEVYIRKDNIPAQEVATAVNLAQKYDGQVNIEIRKKNNFIYTYTTPEAFIVEFQESTFNCISSEYDNNTGKIRKIIFKENT